MFVVKNIGAEAPGPLDDFWYTALGPRSSTGRLVNSANAMRLSAVYKCVRVRSETFGVLPCITYRRLDDGQGKERDTSHPLYEILAHQANDWQTAMQWREMMAAHLDLRGMAFSYIQYNGAGRVQQLIPMHPDRVKVEVVRPGAAPRFRYTRLDGTEQIFVFGEVLFICGLSGDGYSGLNPIELQREALGSAMATRDYGARFFANDARFPGWIGFQGKFADTTAKRKFREDFQAAQSGVNTGKVAVLEHGMTYHELGVKNTDLQFLEITKAQDVDIAGIFRTPPHKIGILDGAKWANIEQQSIDFVTDSIMPMAVRFEQAMLRDLPFGDDHYPEHLLDMLLRGDTSSRYTAYGKGIQDGWLTRNEARQRENLNPIPGLDTPLEPLNMAPAGSKRTAQERGEPPTTRRLASERAYLVMRAAAERVARKEVAGLGQVLKAEDRRTEIDAFFADHGRFVAEVMSVSSEQAMAYCDAAAKRAMVLDLTNGLEAFSRSEWIEIQIAALMRLGEE